jgi:glycosyltransferase involved in cell wall biosynthesis
VRLVFVTQTVDAEHPVLAQTIDVIAALAARVDELLVIAQTAGSRAELPANVRVETFDSSSRLRRGVRFAQLLAAAARSAPRPAGVVAHMVPLYVVLGAPIVKPFGIRVALWYTHWHASRQLRAATAFADVLLSVDRRSFPLDSPKLRGIGHAIDVEQFAPDSRRRSNGSLRLLALGRTARWKGYDTMLVALERALERGLDAELEIRGPQLTPDEHRHRKELETAVEASSVLRGRVRIEEPLPRAELPALLRRSDALLSATQPGETETLDKVVYEAAACGVPVLASNAALDEFLGGLALELRFPPRDADRLAELLLELQAAGPAARADAGTELRRRVVEGHSVDHWADAVVAAVTGGIPR